MGISAHEVLQLERIDPPSPAAEHKVVARTTALNYFVMWKTKCTLDSCDTDGVNYNPYYNPYSVSSFDYMEMGDEFARLFGYKSYLDLTEMQDDDTTRKFEAMVGPYGYTYYRALLARRG